MRGGGGRSFVHKVASSPSAAAVAAPGTPTVSMRELFLYFLKLGWLAFGGPVGQIGLMHLQVVERSKWLTEEEFVRALNFCHVLPGPEALQLAIYIGWKKRGLWAGMLAGLLFILPGFLTLTALAWIYVRFGKRPEVLGVLSGFRPVGLALLLAALVRISKATLKGALPITLAATAFLAFFMLKLPFILVLVGCGVAFMAWKKVGTHRKAASAVGLLVLLPATADAAQSLGARVFDISRFFLNVGLFSFGGAYAVLPLIREGSVSSYGWMTDPQMIDALALGETTPGPLISIGTFVGYMAGHGAGGGLLGAVASTFWLFLPSFVFVLGTARYMDRIVARPGVKEFLKGVTSAVVGLMFSISIPLAKVAFMNHGGIDWLTVVLGIGAFAVLTFWRWRLNVVAVVLAGGVLGLARVVLPMLAGGVASVETADFRWPWE
jgi:chromate transporter